MTTLANTTRIAATRPSVASLLAFWIARQRQRRQLARLEGHLLDDIGLDAPAARREAAKPAWLD